MELKYHPSSSLAIVLHITVLSLFFWLAKLRKSRSVRDNNGVQKLPPGPTKLPIIGNLHNLLTSSLPHRSLRNLSTKYGPLMHLQLGEISAIVVSSPNIAREVMKTHDLCFAQRPELAITKMVTYGFLDIAFSPYGEYWRQMRKVCVLELLSSKRVQSFAYIRESEASKLVESLHSSAGSLVNLTEKIFALTSTVTSRAAFGNLSEEHDTFLSLSKETVKLAGGFDLVYLFPSSRVVRAMSKTRAKLERMHRESDRIQESIIQEHVERQRNIGAEKEKDLVDVLLELQRSDSLEFPITNDNIKAVIWDIFTAGTDTSSTTVDWAMAEMMRNPRVMEKAQAEMRREFKGKKRIYDADIQKLSYLKLVIKETLRLHPPAPLLLPRECRESCVIDGYEIPVKTNVIVNTWAIGRDPEYWQNAEGFEPERFANSAVDYKGTDFEFIPFGAGRRMCPGMSFGLTNVEFPLAQLLYYFDWKLPKGTRPEDLDMTEVFGAGVGRKNALYLIATPYVG